MHSHERTFLSKMGFADPDKKDRRHDWACQYLMQDQVGQHLMQDVGKWRQGGWTYDKHSTVPEVQVVKGEGKYQTTIGFVDLAILLTAGKLARKKCHDVNRWVDVPTRITTLEGWTPERQLRGEVSVVKEDRWSTNRWYFEVLDKEEKDDVDLLDAFNDLPPPPLTVSRFPPPPVSVNPGSRGPSPFVEDDEPSSIFSRKRAINQADKEKRVWLTPPPELEGKRLDFCQKHGCWKVYEPEFYADVRDVIDLVALIEVKITPIPIGDAIRQMLLYAQHQPDLPRARMWGGKYMVLVTAFDIDVDDSNMLAQREIYHRKLGAGFDDYVRQRESSTIPAPTIEL